MSKIKKTHVFCSGCTKVFMREEDGGYMCPECVDTNPIALANKRWAQPKKKQRRRDEAKIERARLYSYEPAFMKKFTAVRG